MLVCFEKNANFQAKCVSVSLAFIQSVFHSSAYFAFEIGKVEKLFFMTSVFSESLFYNFLKVNPHLLSLLLAHKFGSFIYS